MVLGGGVTPGDQTGTQQAGGVSGSSGDLTNFAPLGSSNLVFIGDIKQAEIVNTTSTTGDQCFHPTRGVYAQSLLCL